MATKTQKKTKTRKVSSARRTSKPSKPKEPEFWYDPIEAERPIEFIETHLINIEGLWAGTRVRLQDWQKDIIRKYFGWMQYKKFESIPGVEFIVRKYRTLYLEIPRKAGKTSLVAWLLCYLLCCEGEQRGQLYSGAGDVQQADIIFGMVRDLIKSCPALSSRCIVQDKGIKFLPTSTVFQSITSNAATKHGFNANAFVIDELHVQKNRKLVDVLHTSQGTRLQPSEIFITTAGTDRDSICYELHEHAKYVMAHPEEDPTFLGYIFAADEKDDWTDPRTWMKANPNLGVSVPIKYLEDEFRAARLRPAAEVTFKNLYLNIWTESRMIWIPHDIWIKGNRKFEPRDLEGMKCYGGLDLSTKHDFTALGLVFPFENGSYKLLRYLWHPADTLQDKEDRDRKPYRDWLRRKLFEATPGNIVDHDFVKARIVELANVFDIAELGFDPWGATQIANQLAGDGLNMVEMRQGFRTMSEPTKEFEALAIAGRLLHASDPILDWMLQCVEILMDPAGNVKPDKSQAAKSKTRIDGIVALIMALGRAIANNEIDINAHILNSGLTFF